MTTQCPNLTRKQAAIIGAYTGILCGPFEDLHEYIEQLLDRPVFTHELANKATWAKIKLAAKPDFLAIRPLVTESVGHA